MEYQEFTGKTLSDAVTNALIALETSRDNLEYEVIEKGSNGFLGIGARDAKIRAKLKVLPKKSIEEVASDFLKSVFQAMNLEVKVIINVHEDMMEDLVDATLLMEGGYKILNRDEILQIFKESM